MDFRIMRAIRLLEEGLGEDIDYQAVATAVGLSLHRFHHLFVETFGETPGGYVRRIRLDAAAMRLRWTTETAGHIAHSMGYGSQSAFNTAFEKKFGVSPGRFRKYLERRPSVPIEEIKHRKITLREAPEFHCVAKRYFGPDRQVHSHWVDFIASLPQGFATDARKLYLGLTYDDPRFTPEHLLRYDCCVTISESADSLRLFSEGQGFHRLITRPGLHACVGHMGSYLSSRRTYGLLLDHWLVNSRYTLTDDPMIELYTVPPSQIADDELQFTLLLPLY